MGRIKKTDGMKEIVEEPMVVKRETQEGNGNGIIPVKYDYAEMYYDTKEHTYFCVIRVDTKKLRFELVK